MGISNLILQIYFLILPILTFVFFIIYLKNSNIERKNNHENQSNSRHPEDRQDR